LAERRINNLRASFQRERARFYLVGSFFSSLLAKSLGFDGVQVSIGKGTDSLQLADSALQKAYLDESKRVGLPVESLCLEVLHRNFLKSDPLGARWVADSVGIARQ